METIELFCGTKSFSKAAAQHGFGTFTVDVEHSFAPDIVGDIGKLVSRDLPQRPFVLWASPPCQAFSVAAIGKNWNRDGTPKHRRAVQAQKLVLQTLALIRDVKPEWWFIENPRGMLRKMPFMRTLMRRTVTYCQYGDMRQKPTDIWTNAHWWVPRSPCAPGAACHEAAPRGARTGTQGIKGAVNRSRIPAGLFDELFDQVPIRSMQAA